MAEAAELGVEDVHDLLVHLYGLEGEVRGSEFRVLCPKHEMDGREHDPSVDVNLETGLWNCWSCSAGGDLLDLGKILLKRSRKEVRKLLRPNEPDAIRAAIQRRLDGRRTAARPIRARSRRNEVSLPSAGSYEAGPLTYLYDRGFERETLKRWGVRFAPLVTLFRETGKSFEITNAIAIPIYSEFREILSWCYRSTPDSEKWFQKTRYIYTPGVQDTLSRNWFGMHLHREASELTVVEGALDAIWCHQHGIPAVAILGSQVKQLVKIRRLMNFRKITILTDRDEAGVATAFGLGTALQERGVPVTICRYATWMTNRYGKPAKDAQDLCGVDLELVHARAIPFLVWKHREAA